MLLLHQIGSVKIGEVVRYTITYTPADDRILPSPPNLYLKIKNTSTIALRAAFVHGPYTLYVSSSPSTFQPNQKFENPRRDGVPEFEPQLKAGASWQSQLVVPESVRKTAGSARSHHQQQVDDGGQANSVSWIVEVASQVIFSNSAAVHYEILLGRDEKSLSLGLYNLSTGNGPTSGIPGQVSDHQQSQGAKDGHHSAQPKGVFSRAIKLRVDDTASLWNKPKLPEWDEAGKQRGEENNADAPVENVMGEKAESLDDHRNKRQKKVHLVVLTHGLHSNLGADMLYLKESIDEASIQAKEHAKLRRANRHEAEKQCASATGTSIEDYRKNQRRATPGGEKAPAEQTEDNTDEAEDDEEVIVRGFSGNAVRTEKGIKYLGKRLAKYVLAMTYPDQPFKPIVRTATHSLSAAIRNDVPKDQHTGSPAHLHSTILKEPYKDRKQAHQITSISFIGHSLGGLIQTYAIAYIQKHSPHFFDLIKPVNFITLATPFLGLSNENPIYVKFALDFGFVGRTGQDLGLTWRPPALARTGWGAIVSGIGESAQKKAERQQDPRSKPLLRILPTGPAHAALRKFRHRTIYSNVVNDGIVPLRTSCLLFLDWQGLGRVEKARRENGLVGTVAGWGWAELTGSNASAAVRRPWLDEAESTDGRDDSGMNTPGGQGKGNEVPQPSENEAIEADDDARSLKLVEHRAEPHTKVDAIHSPVSPTTETTNSTGPLESFLGLFRPNATPKSSNSLPKQSKIYKRSQTIKFDDGINAGGVASNNGPSGATSGEAVLEEPDSMSAPPKTTFFEAAGDLLNPPIPPMDWLIDPSARPRTIFHDRVYHPDDIPPLPLKRSRTSSLARHKLPTVSLPPSESGASIETRHLSIGSAENLNEVVDSSALKVEEKIARAYHRDLSWRKVLVRLEPDAHNNMIVRRRFANAYGWPVVKHLVDTHFSDESVAKMRDEDESHSDRAKSSHEMPTESGVEVNNSESDTVKGLQYLERTNSEKHESRDEVPPLNSIHPGSLAQALNSAKRPAKFERKDSAQWSDGDFVDSEDDSDAEQTSEPQSTLVSHSKSASTSNWNWTEAIVGKGAISPRGTRPKATDDLLSPGSGGGPAAATVDGGDDDNKKKLTAGAATPQVVSDGSGIVGLGKSLSSRPRGDDGPGVAEEVARKSFRNDPPT